MTWPRALFGEKAMIAQAIADDSAEGNDVGNAFRASSSDMAAENAFRASAKSIAEYAFRASAKVNDHVAVSARDESLCEGGLECTVAACESVAGRVSACADTIIC